MEFGNPRVFEPKGPAESDISAQQATEEHRERASVGNQKRRSAASDDLVSEFAHPIRDIAERFSARRPGVLVRRPVGLSAFAHRDVKVVVRPPFPLAEAALTKARIKLDGKPKNIADCSRGLARADKVAADDSIQADPFERLGQGVSLITAHAIQRNIGLALGDLRGVPVGLTVAS